MQVSGAEAIVDAAAFFRQIGAFGTDIPASGEAPFVAARILCAIDVNGIVDDSVGAEEILCAEGDDRARHTLDNGWKQEDDPEAGEDDHRGQPAIFVGLCRPAATECVQRCDEGQGQRHAHEHRQGAAQEGLSSPREDKGQDRQDAGAEDAREIGQDGKGHGSAFPDHAAAGVKVMAKPFMQ